MRAPEPRNYDRPRGAPVPSVVMDRPGPQPVRPRARRQRAPDRLHRGSAVAPACPSRRFPSSSRRFTSGSRSRCSLPRPRTLDAATPPRPPVGTSARITSRSSLRGVDWVSGSRPAAPGRRAGRALNVPLRADCLRVCEAIAEACAPDARPSRSRWPSATGRARPLAERLALRGTSESSRSTSAPSRCSRRAHRRLSVDRAGAAADRALRRRDRGFRACPRHAANPSPVDGASLSRPPSAVPISWSRDCSACRASDPRPIWSRSYRAGLFVWQPDEVRQVWQEELGKELRS